MGWQTLKVGAGGFVRGVDVASDGTMVAFTDTDGAYLWNGTSWVQLVTASSMPAAFVAANPTVGQGVYDIQIAASNTNIMYMMFDGYMWKTTNKGTSWTQTTFAQVSPSTSVNANGSYTQYGQKIAVDPNNPNIVYAGTGQNGMFVTMNGGQTWSKVSALPIGTNAGITGILFDPAIGGVVNGATQTIFASSSGNGVYESTNGGATWTALTGGPTDVEYAAVSSTGVYYAVGNGGSGLWIYVGGKWTKLFSQSGLQAVAVNPSNPNEIVAMTTSDAINVSYNAGATWSGVTQINTLSSTDIPWLAAGNEGVGSNAGYAWLDIGGLAFSPTTPNQLIATGGTGVWSTTVPASGFTSSTKLTLSDMSVGIENLVANEIIVPPGGNPVLASWDRPFFYISNASAYPSTYSPVASDNMNEGWSIDYASSSPSFLVGIADWSGTEQSGYSTNGGQTWTTFASTTPTTGGLIGGTIAASTTQNIVWAPSGGVDPYYTTNGGASWSPVTLPGVTSWSGFDWAYYLDQRSVTADRVLANTFYLYYPGQGVFSTTNGGSSWTKVFSGQIGPNDGYNSEIQSMPGEARNLFYTAGPNGTPSATPANQPFYRSTNGGETWTAVPNVLDVFAFGYGAAAPGQSYPAIYIVGYVNNVYGVWQSTNNAQSWTNIGTFPTGELDQIKTIAGDPNNYGAVYVGFNGGGYAYLPATTGSTGTGTTTGSTGTSPAITGISESPATGDLNAGNTVALTLTFSENVAVAGGAPTLTLNDGGTATYASGSGTSALTFNYTVATGQNVAALAATAIDLPTGVTIKDSAGNPSGLSLSGLTQSGPQIDTTAPAAPTISSDTVSGNIVTLKGAAAASSTIAVFDNSTKLGTATASSSGAWTFATGALASGSQSFTATSTDGAANASPLSSAFAVTLAAGSSGSVTGSTPPTDPPSDFNGDSHSDILWQNTSSGQVSIWEMNGTNVIGGGRVGVNPGLSWKAIGTGDFNDDGHSDILFQNTSSGQASIWEMNGVNMIDGGAVSSNPGPSWKAVGTGDFNDDGHSDILWQNANGQASISEMNGTNVIGGGPVGANPGPSWEAIGTGDFNDDGYSDILWQNTSTGQVSIWEIGGGTVGVNPGLSWKAIGTGDFNGDGHSDILFQNTSSGQVSIWEMNGVDVIGGGTVGANPGPSLHAIGTGDFNGDGFSDILFQNTSGQATIWEMNGVNVIDGGPVGANPRLSWHAVGV